MTSRVTAPTSISINKHNTCDGVTALDPPGKGGANSKFSIFNFQFSMLPHTPSNGDPEYSEVDPLYSAVIRSDPQSKNISSPNSGYPADVTTLFTLHASRFTFHAPSALICALFSSLGIRRSGVGRRHITIAREPDDGIKVNQSRSSQIKPLEKNSRKP